MSLRLRWPVTLLVQRPVPLLVQRHVQVPPLCPRKPVKPLRQETPVRLLHVHGRVLVPPRRLHERSSLLARGHVI